jgi:hypothetical protein
MPGAAAGRRKDIAGIKVAHTYSFQLNGMEGWCLLRLPDQ